MIERFLFWLAVAGAAGLIWQTPYLPMADLPQHVGQVSVLHDLWLETSPWAGELRINYFTPYLLVYLPAALLSLLVAPLTAVKLLLTAAMLGWIRAGQRLLAHTGAEPRLIWLWLPAWFGFDWYMGFVTFLAGAPLLILFIPLADRYAQAPTRRDGLWLALSVLSLFFCHALIFYFAGLIGGLLLLLHQHRHWRRLLLACTPYLLALIPALAHAGYSYLYDPQVADAHTKLFSAPRSLMLFGAQSAAPFSHSHIYGLVLTLAAVLLSMKKVTNRAAWVPLVAFLLAWHLLPFNQFGVGYLFTRYSLFFLPFLTLVLAPAPNQDGIRRGTMACIIVTCLLALGQLALFQADFARAGRAYWQAVAPIPPQKRILLLDEYALLVKTENSMAFTFYGLWYQPVRQGWAEFNFASFRPQIVRYAGTGPAVQNSRQTGYWELFDWASYEAGRYDYFVVYHESRIPAGLFAGSPCGVRLVSAVGYWSVFAPRRCDTDTP